MVAVIALVNYNGMILTGKKKIVSDKYLSNTWHIPGETVKEREIDEQALIRGVKEEAGIEIKVII